MNVNKAHCFFEQSGTFKNEFKKLGISAFDYDIQNEFGQTDYVVDLFKAIEYAYDEKPSLFDTIKGDDLIIAFFPCVYFESVQMLDFCLARYGTENKPIHQRVEYALDKLKKRTYFHEVLYKFAAVCDKRGLRLIIENPATPPNYLITGQNFLKPTFIDHDRTLRGDFYKKPTAYWFFNCKTPYGETEEKSLIVKKILKSKKGKTVGLCSTERSMIAPAYARNFIRDFILGI